MCHPLAIAAGSMALSAYGSIKANQAQAAAEKANREAAERAFKANVKEIGSQQLETRMAAAQNIFFTERKARTARSLARVGAGEAGVAGISAQDVLDDITREAGDVSRVTRKQERAEIAGLQRAKISQTELALGRKSQVGKPSDLATGLAIAGAGLNFGQFLIRDKVPGDTESDDNDNDDE